MRHVNTVEKKQKTTNKVAVAISSFLDKISFERHLILSFLIRLGFIVFGEFQDRYVEVPFTDVDYRVVTDGARHALNGQSPYKRHTYRYTPILAYLLTGNILIHSTFGKVLFSLFDILIGATIRQIILDEHLHTFEANAASLLKKNKRFAESSTRFHLTPKHERNATFESLFWLYNPMAIVIATRGNGDSITSLFILLTIFALQRSIRQPAQNDWLYVVLAGVFHGLAIHVRLYPLIFSLAYYLYLGEASSKPKTIFNVIFQFNKKQIILVSSTVVTLAILTTLFYHNFGYEFLHESYFYHLMRKDIRHNFSLYFYMNYLNSKPMLFEKVLTFLPQLLILLSINIYFGIHRKTIVVVVFNPVVTSQYFIWYLAILPICLKNFKSMRIKRAFSCGIFWCFIQAFWLYSAYLLEFKGWNTFGFIWMQGAIFFVANCLIMKELIDHFDVIADF